MENLLLLLFLFSIPLFLLSLVVPEKMLPIFKGKLQKKGMRWLFGLLIPVSFVLFGNSLPQENLKINPPAVSVQQENLSNVQQVETETQLQEIVNEPVPIIEVKKEITTEKIPFSTTTRDDSNLEKGKTKVIQEGVDGLKEFVYDVTYTDGKETDRKLSSENVKVAPANKIVANGTKEPASTYTAPATSISTSCGEDYYRNSDGVCVHRPSTTISSGATAQCRDGSYSFSQHRSGTCSGHGGVAIWF